MTTVLLAAFFSVSALRAQPTEQTVQSRFLFVFDTARDMKPRVEAVQKTLNLMLATSLNGQLHAGDSVGVWTFSQNLRPGDYPLQTWNPDHAALIASNLVRFVGGQHYAKSAHFEVLPPVLDKVVEDSERLTVLIFCDGAAKFSGTPFDDGVNRLFAQKLAAQKKAQQPFVVVLRSQLGKFTGCSVGLPPSPLDYPQFPPLPLPPPPAPKLNNPPPPAPVITGPPLIIIGTNISNHAPQPAQNSPSVASPPVALILTNIPAAPSATSLPTNLSASTAASTKVDANVATAPPSPPNAVAANSHFWVVGVGLFVAAVAVGIFVRLTSRRKDTSLITHSMHGRK